MIIEYLNNEAGESMKINELGESMKS